MLHTDGDSAARRFLKRREGDVANDVPLLPRVNRIRFEDLVEDLLNDYRSNGLKSYGDVKRRCKLHLTPFFGGRRAVSISTSDVRKFTAARLAAGASNAEINRELAALKRAFNLAIQGGRLLNKPYIPMLAEDNVRQGFFEPKQFEAILWHLSETIQPVVRFMYITGWRNRSEVYGLEWRNVDFDGNCVQLDPGTTKNKAGRVFPFTNELRALLESQKAVTEALNKKKGVICPWVFHRNGASIRDFRKAWKTACKNAGVPDRIQHDFRRTAVRNLVRAGVPERVAMQMTGHKTRAVFERYNIVSEADLTDAARRLDLATGTNPSTVARNQPSHRKASKLQPV